MLHSQKRELFKNGEYKCPAPDGDTAKWTVNQWVDYIDNNGEWL